jgi:hypothetical protein
MKAPSNNENVPTERTVEKVTLWQEEGRGRGVISSKKMFLYV